jgi:hypothetical protein
MGKRQAKVIISLEKKGQMVYMKNEYRICPTDFCLEVKVDYSSGSYAF